MPEELIVVPADAEPPATEGEQSMSSTVTSGRRLDYPHAKTYHADTQLVSHSALEAFRESRWSYYLRYITGELPAKEPTPAMQLGTALHAYCLERENYGALVAVSPELAPDGKPWLRRKGSDHERWWQEWLSQSRHKAVITEDQWATVQQMAQALRNEPRCKYLLEAAGENEVSVGWQDATTGVACKCRPDRLVENVVVNLKTTAATTAGGFARQCASLGYHRADAFYRDGVAALLGTDVYHVFVVVSTVPPHEAAVYELDEPAVALGREQYRKSLSDLTTCRETGNWRPATWGQVVRLGLPTWAFYDDQWEV